MKINDIQLKFGFTDRYALHNKVMSMYPLMDDSEIDVLVYEYCKKENEKSYPEVTFTGM